MISVVILSKNGGELFRQSLEAIFQQEIHLDFEVIVVDSGSTDSTLDILSEFPIRLYQIQPEEFSFGPTRDYGFGLASGDYIATLSQDVVPASMNWLQNLVQPLVDDHADLVQGKDIFPEEVDIFFWEKEGLFYRSVIDKEFIHAYGGFGISCTNMAIKKNVWDEVRFGNIPMNEDKALQKRLTEKGFRLSLQPDAVAYHGHQYTLRSLIRRCENEGMGWKLVGVSYSFKDLCTDLFRNRWFLSVLYKGVRNGEVKRSSEYLFPLLRPLCLYKGNLLNREFKG